MTILIDQDTRVIIQGITGKVGSFQAKIMKDYGTNIVAGVTPGKGGMEVHGIPVFDFVEDACELNRPTAAFCFVPAKYVRAAAFEVIKARIALLIITSEGVPDKDMLDILHYAKRNGTRVIGPDTPGIISPGVCKLGVHPDKMFIKGHVGVLSKSGALSYEICKNLTENGIGQSTVVGIGGGPIWGSTQKEILELFFSDPETRAVVMLGEVGGSMEIEAAEYIRMNPVKPAVALIVGRNAPEGAQMGHAGAIIEGKEGTAKYKIETLREAGVLIAKNPSEVVQHIHNLRL